MEELYRTIERIVGVAISLIIILPILQHFLKVDRLMLFEMFGVEMLKASVMR